MVGPTATAGKKKKKPRVFREREKKQLRKASVGSATWCRWIGHGWKEKKKSPMFLEREREKEMRKTPVGSAMWCRSA